MYHKKFGPDRFSRFDVYWIHTDRQTNRQTPRQAKFIYRSYENEFCFGLLIKRESGFCLENVTMIQIQDMFKKGKPDIVLKTVNRFNIKRTPCIVLLSENSLKLGIVVLASCLLKCWL